MKQRNFCCVNIIVVLGFLVFFSFIGRKDYLKKKSQLMYLIALWYHSQDSWDVSDSNFLSPSLLACSKSEIPSGMHEQRYFLKYEKKKMFSNLFLFFVVYFRKCVVNLCRIVCFDATYRTVRFVNNWYFYSCHLLVCTFTPPIYTTK